MSTNIGSKQGIKRVSSCLLYSKADRTYLYLISQDIVYVYDIFIDSIPGSDLSPVFP